MGKSLKNIVSPDEMYQAYGTDTFRLYEMGMGPLAQSKPWETRAVVGSQRFLQRLWRNVVDEETGELVVDDIDPDDTTLRALHKTIEAVDRDYEDLSFNTAIARLTEYNTALTKLKVVPRSAVEPLILMVAPLAPTSPRNCGAVSGMINRWRMSPSPWRIPSWSPRTPSPLSCRYAASCEPSWR